MRWTAADDRLSDSRHPHGYRPCRRPYSPGLEGVAGETSSYVDGANGRLLYRGYRIGDLVDRGTYPAVANLPGRASGSRASPSDGSSARPVMDVLRVMPSDAKPMDALRTAVSAWAPRRSCRGHRRSSRPARHRLLASALAAFARLRTGMEPIDPDPDLDLTAGFLYQLTGELADDGTVRALDAYFIVGAEHSFNASTFTARVISSTRSDIASAVAGAIGTGEGALHGGAPSEVVDQLLQVGSTEHAEQWIRDTLARGERLMGFGHRVYRAYDPRVAALRKVAEGMEHKLDWLKLATEVEDVALSILAEKHLDRPLVTNVEYYAALVLMGVGLKPDLFPATFSLARHAGWTAHALEQAANNRLICLDVNYVGPEERTCRADSRSGRHGPHRSLRSPLRRVAGDVIHDVLRVAPDAEHVHRRERPLERDAQKYRPEAAGGSHGTDIGQPPSPTRPGTSIQR